jgi:hypothetical protein
MFLVASYGGRDVSLPGPVFPRRDTLFTIERGLLLSLHSRSPTLILPWRLASLSFALAVVESFVLFLNSAMARIKSTAHPIDATAETGSEGHGSENSAERMESAPLSDVGSDSGARGEMDEGSRT